MEALQVHSFREILTPLKGEQGKMNFFLMLVWASYPLSLMFNFFFSKVPLLKEDKDLVFPVFLVICLFFVIKDIVKGNFIKVLFFYIIISFVIVFLAINAPVGNTRYIEDYLPAFYFTVLPFVFIGNAFKDERIFNLIYYASIIGIFVTYANYFIIHPLSEILFDEETQSTQGVAYIFLPYILTVIWKLLERFSLFKLLLLIFSLLALLMLGSRGAFLSPIIFVFLFLVLCKKFYKNKVLMFFLLLSATLIFVYFDQILLFMIDYITGEGYSTRIVELLSEGEISYDNGRYFIVEKIINTLDSHPWGLGLCGSQVVASGFYAHNLFLELIATFGWYFGGLICVLLIVFIVKGFISCEDDTQRGFYLVLLCTSFIPLMFSGIFLREPFLFMFLGYNFCLIDKKSRTRKAFAHSS